MSDENLGINIDLNSILGISDEQEPVEPSEPQEKPRAQRARCHTERGQKMFDKRRFFSEKPCWIPQNGITGKAIFIALFPEETSTA